MKQNKNHNNNKSEHITVKYEEKIFRKKIREKFEELQPTFKP